MSSLSITSSLSSVALHPNSPPKPSFDGPRIQFPIRTHRSAPTTSSSRSRSLSVVVKAKKLEKEGDGKKKKEEVFEFMFDEEDDEMFIKRIKAQGCRCEWNPIEMRWFGERLLRVLDKKPSERNEADKKFANLVEVFIHIEIFEKLIREGTIDRNDYLLPADFVEDAMKDYDKFFPF